MRCVICDNILKTHESKWREELGEHDCVCTKCKQSLAKYEDDSSKLNVEGTTHGEYQIRGR